MKVLRMSQLREKKNGEQRRLIYAFIALLLGCAIVTSGYSQEQDKRIFNNVDATGLILDGYDPVAFFTHNKPVKGDPMFSYQYEGARYHFVSEQHLNLFKAMP